MSERIAAEIADLVEQEKLSPLERDLLTVLYDEEGNRRRSALVRDILNSRGRRLSKRDVFETLNSVCDRYDMPRGI